MGDTARHDLADKLRNLFLNDIQVVFLLEDRFPDFPWPEAFDVPPPWEGGDGTARNDPERKRAAKLNPVPRS